MNNLIAKHWFLITLAVGCNTALIAGSCSALEPGFYSKVKDLSSYRKIDNWRKDSDLEVLFDDRSRTFSVNGCDHAMSSEQLLNFAKTRNRKQLLVMWIKLKPEDYGVAAQTSELTTQLTKISNGLVPVIDSLNYSRNVVISGSANQTQLGYYLLSDSRVH